MRLNEFLALTIASVTMTRFAITQSVFVVAPNSGPGVFSTQIQPAVDAAMNGDLILLKSGNYLGFAIDGKSLVVVAELGASVNVSGAVAVSNLTSSQSALIERITVSASTGFANFLLNNDAGPVWIEDCVIAPVSGATVHGLNGADVVQCASVAFLRCTLSGSNAMAFKGPSTPGSGFFASGSTVTLFESTCIGGAGESAGFFPGTGSGAPGAHLNGSSAYASRTVFQGGVGGSSPFPPPLIINGGSGGNGIVTDSAFVALGCTFLGGNGGSSASGTSGSPGNPGNDATEELSGTPRHFKASSPVRELHNSTWTCGGLPGESAAVVISLDQDTGIFFPYLNGVLLPSLAGADTLLLGTISGNGMLSVQQLVSSLPSAVKGQAIYLQSFFFDPSLTYVVVGPASALVVLDSSL